jgi:hypothetical protein
MGELAEKQTFRTPGLALLAGPDFTDTNLKRLNDRETL